MSDKSDDIWKIMTGKILRIPSEFAAESNSKKVQYQLFEVIFTKLISLICSGYSWKVTPVQGDGGVDFYGVQTLFSVPCLEIEAKLIIGGQCKRSKHRSNPTDLVGSDIIKIIHNLHPAYIVIGLAADIPRELRIKSIAELSAVAQVPFYIFGLKEIDSLIRRHFSEVEPIIRKGISQDQAKVLVDYFSQDRPTVTQDLETDVFSPSYGHTGIPFEIVVRFSSTTTGLGSLRASWSWPVEMGHESTNIRLIKPVQAVQGLGVSLEAEDLFSASLSLKFISYIAGEQPLGDLEIWSGKSKVKIIPLGAIKLADLYHPPFYRVPFEAHLSQFGELLEQTSAGSIRSAVVFGAGGAGKTRLCQEFGYLAEMRDFNWISISHTNNFNSPYRLLGDLLKTLVRRLDVDDPRKTISERVWQLNSDLAERSSSTLEALFSLESKSITGTFSKENVVQLVVLLMLDRFRGKRAGIIHLSDLHWSHNDVLIILRETLSRLRAAACECQIRVLFLFEGRVRESLGRAFAQGSECADEKVSTIEFEKFVEAGHDAKLPVGPLDEKFSHGFLENIFENRQALARRVPDNLIPHQKNLISEILRYGRGNPFHMVEQIKLLKYKGIIEHNPRTGLLFLARKLDELYSPPPDVETLIRNRFAYVETYYPSAANLIRAIGLIKDRMEIGLFEALQANLAPTISRQLLEATDFIIFPFHSMGEVCFRHENYYEVIKSITLSPKERDLAVKTYLQWMDNLDLTRKGAQFFLEYALVRAEASSLNQPEVMLLLQKALAIAESLHQYQLAGRILNFKLSIFPDVLHSLWTGTQAELVEFCSSKLRHAELNIFTGNWKCATSELSDVIHVLDNKNSYESSSEDAGYIRYAATAQLANTYINQLKTHRAIEILEESLHIILSLGSSKAAHWRDLKLCALNRLGVAYWHDGNYSEAQRILGWALEEGRKTSDKGQEHVSLLDLGVVTLHWDTALGMKLIEESISLLPETSFGPRHSILAEITLTMALMIGDGQARIRQKEVLRTCVDQLEDLYGRARLGGFGQEQSAASLLLGTALAILDPTQAARWFMESIAICYQHNLLETLWKAHLNLAQVCLQLDGEFLEGAGLHAQYAEGILRMDLQERNERQKLYRLRHLRLPLIQVARIWRSLGDNRACRIAEDYPEIKVPQLFQSSWPEILNRHMPDQILLLTNDSNDYFLYSA